MDKHAAGFHSKIKDFECNQCSYTTSHKGNLEQHVKGVHNKIKDFKCDQCNNTTSGKENLKQHIKDVHVIFVNMQQQENINRKNM